MTKPEITSQPERLIVAMARDFTMKTRAGIPDLWQDWSDRALDLPGAVAGVIYGVSFSMTPEGAFRYGVGVEVRTVLDKLPKDTCVLTLSAGDYAVLKVFGPIEDLPGHFDAMFNRWLPGSDYRQREGAVFERYPDDPRNGPEKRAYEIWVPVARG